MTSLTVGGMENLFTIKIKENIMIIATEIRLYENNPMLNDRRHNNAYKVVTIDVLFGMRLSASARNILEYLEDNSVCLASQNNFTNQTNFSGGACYGNDNLVAMKIESVKNGGYETLDIHTGYRHVEIDIQRDNMPVIKKDEPKFTAPMVEVYKITLMSDSKAVEVSLDEIGSLMPKTMENMVHTGPRTGDWANRNKATVFECYQRGYASKTYALTDDREVTVFIKVRGVDVNICLAPAGLRVGSISTSLNEYLRSGDASDSDIRFIGYLTGVNAMDGCSDYQKSAVGEALLTGSSRYDLTGPGIQETIEILYNS